MTTHVVSLRNWSSHNRYWLQPSTLVELCWKSSGL